MKKLVWFLSLVIVILGVSLAYSIRLNVTNEKESLQKIVVRQSDRSALSSMNALYERYLDHSSDYLVVIGYSIDSGPIITSINLDKGEIVWIEDRTKDQYSGGGVFVNQCKAMLREEDDTGVLFSVSNCEGYPADDVKGSIHFLK
ncbi:DUF4362 domain-containing protein [Paenibacillus xylaniclasticus]|uniref:DUF4362 domain-containing protein n=1 Tax=Paenibacillus xylaniclasticus TaxID=588083 RepID=UPI0013DF59BA|nr:MULTISPECIES: DUF4362 domain-containing protein [Paenibacillus]GFN33296.1 hypothetical protein PCURB6_35560 [Paenibacillus curdlanolyticus]